MKVEMSRGGESSVGSDSAVFSSDIASGGCGGVGKRVRVSSCGFEKGGTEKRAKQGFFLPHNFLDPLPKPVVLAPKPLSVRPLMSFSPLHPVGPTSTASPATPTSIFPTVASHPKVSKCVFDSVIRPTAAEASDIKSVKTPSEPVKAVDKVEANGCKQFWKAGDYEGAAESSSTFPAEIDRVRVHPKFLHSNATSHKWALGALAELLDNSMDEVCNGATFVSIDVLENPKDRTKMLLVEDNGGGMDPDKMRQCMSLGYSMKSKSANTIGQYGNGFKTSTMRLGADVIVFSRCRGNDGMSPTQSIGILSYTFLRNTGKQDIIVPMIDYEKRGDDWHQIERSSSVALKTNMDSILQWSPFCSEDDLLQQFNLMQDQGTRIIIYNLWEDDEGHLELDFVTDAQDIQIGDTNRDEKKIKMSENFLNSRHFLTYHHSLRSYASILYLRLPQGFRMILRGKEIEHHNIVNDMMMKEEKIYRPQAGPDGVPKDPNIFAVMTIGFVKDATNHVDVQGFNVYHKNRLIKPFWRVWNAAGSDGRGVIGVLEANFIEPAHDKQGFERTTVLNRLEARLLHIQKTYWSSNCHKIGYAPRRQKKSLSISESKESSPEDSHQLPSTPTKAATPNFVQSQDSSMNQNSCKHSLHQNARESGNSVTTDEFRKKKPQKNGFEKSEEHKQSESEPFGTTEYPPTSTNLDGFDEAACSSLLSSSLMNEGLQHNRVFAGSAIKNVSLVRSCSNKIDTECYANELEHLNAGMHTKLRADENWAMKERINTMERQFLQDLQIEREKNKELTRKVELLEKRLQDADIEQEALVNILLEERSRRETEDVEWLHKLEVANSTIKNLEKLATAGIKSEVQM